MISPFWLIVGSFFSGCMFGLLISATFNAKREYDKARRARNEIRSLKMERRK